MTISTASVGEELAMLKRAVVALEAKLPPTPPAHPRGGGDAAFKILQLADDLKSFGHQPRKECK